MGKKVLIVDDDCDVRLLLVSVMRKEGWETLEVPSGEQCLEMAKEARPDLILLDYNMPGMNGRETLNRLRESGSMVPVIVVTAVSSDDLPRHFLEDGAFDFLSKPIKKSDLVFSSEKAFQYKTLLDRLSSYKEKDYNFSDLEQNLAKLAEGKPGMELGKYILLERQKAFVLQDFFSQYLVKKPSIHESVSVLRNFVESLDSSHEGTGASDAAWRLKNIIYDLDVALENTVTLLDKLKLREQRFKEEDKETEEK